MRNENRKHLVWTILIAMLVFFILFFYSQDGFRSAITGLGIYNPEEVEDNYELIGDENNNLEDNDEDPPSNKGIVVNVGNRSSYSSGGGSSSGGGGGGSSGGGGGSSTSPQGQTKKTLNINILTSHSKYIKKDLNENITIDFSVNHDKDLSYCNLSFNNEIISYILNPQLGTIYFFELSNLSAGKYPWKIMCKDIENKTFESEIKKSVVIKNTIFKGKSTNLENLNDLERVDNLILELGDYGIIEFIMPVNLSRGIDFDKYIKIKDNYIEIDSEFLPELNVSAILTFYNVNKENPIILIDGEVCEDCVILENNGNLTFQVNHFSTYTSSENSELHIYDDTDTSIKIINEDVYFYANFTNVTDDSAIQGGGTYCNITFPVTGTVAMTYNGASGLYEYDRQFTSYGSYLFIVNCYGASLGFTNLNLNESYSITQINYGTVTGANITEIKTETAPADNPDEHDAFAGNVTSIILFGYSVTQSWQGYFGNVSGTIQLADGNDNVLYNWSVANPEGEVYATKSNGLSWVDIQCFNFSASGVYGDESGSGGTTNINGTNLGILESQYNINSSDVDGVDETFTLLGGGTHDLFYTASNEFSEGECRSTLIYGDTGAGVSDEFEEVLLYEPVSASIVFTALIEESTVLGFDNKDYDFQMLVLEDGHGSDIVTTTYYFFIELE